MVDELSEYGDDDDEPVACETRLRFSRRLLAPTPDDMARLL
jgi:hypothetical protein